MDRTSLLSFHQKLGNGSAAFILPEITSVQQPEKLPGRLSIQPHRLDERAS